METLKKIIIGAGIITGLVGGIYLNYQGTVSERNNLTYRGYHVNKADGINLLVFDGYHIDEPDLRIIGNPDGLETGTRYNVKIKSPRWIGEDTADSIKATNPNK